MWCASEGDFHWICTAVGESDFLSALLRRIEYLSLSTPLPYSIISIFDLEVNLFQVITKLFHSPKNLRMKPLIFEQ